MGEGAYTKIPERSHALFPVAQYEFIWAHQLWNLTEESDAYFNAYLDHYILPDGNFLYNTQDQVEAPLKVGLFLRNNARAYDYTRDEAAFKRRLPTLERMLAYVLARYEFGKRRYPLPDRRYGLIWGSPEADLGDPNNDFPDSHPFYYQNAANVWRGVQEHARVLDLVATAGGKPGHRAASARYKAVARPVGEPVLRPGHADREVQREFALKGPLAGACHLQLRAHADHRDRTPAVQQRDHAVGGQHAHPRVAPLDRS